MNDERWVQHFDKKFDEIRVDYLDVKILLAKQEVILERNTDSLVEHMRRTDALEAQVSLVKKDLHGISTVYSTLSKLSSIAVVLAAGGWALAKYIFKF